MDVLTSMVQHRTKATCIWQVSKSWDAWPAFFNVSNLEEEQGPGNKHANLISRIKIFLWKVTKRNWSKVNTVQNYLIYRDKRQRKLCSNQERESIVLSLLRFLFMLCHYRSLTLCRKETVLSQFWGTRLWCRRMKKSKQTSELAKVILKEKPETQTFSSCCAKVPSLFHSRFISVVCPAECWPQIWSLSSPLLAMLFKSLL